MQKLSQVLENISPIATPNDNEQPMSQHGSTTIVGTTTTQTQLAMRQAPLTQSQLTQIASSLLREPPSIACIKRKKYGRKILHDEFGEYILDDQYLGDEEAVEVSLQFMSSIKPNALAAALRVSPVEAVVAHLSRLSMHKRLGSSDQDRAILLGDYADRLKNYPEFIVFLACKHFWENDKNPFFPKIATMIEVIDELIFSVKQQEKKLNTPPKLKPVPAPKPRPDWKDLPREQWDAQHWIDYVADAQSMLALAEQNPQFMRPDLWQQQLAARQNEAQAHTIAQEAAA